MSSSIDELRQRWEADPSPQLSLHLAEEYRRENRLEDAIRVLTRGLEDHPDHVAARVALGRYQLDLGHLEEARELLERVAEEDPTHLVASKLLVRLHLDAGEMKQARDRLDLYRLLNERDPDIPALQDRLEGRVAVPTEAGSSPPVPVLDVPRNGDPFRELWAGLDSERYWQSLASEGIFPVARRAVAAGEPSRSRGTEEVPTATVTLARLYLRQGHVRDAERTFQEVLAREPENAEARAALEAIRSTPAEPVLEETESAEEKAARKIEALRDYLRRIRSAARQA